MAEEIQNFEILNQKVQQWSAETAALITSRISGLGIIDTGKLLGSIKGRIRYESGVSERVSYPFPRYGIFIAKGVGKGWPIESVKGNGAIIAAAGRKARAAKDWFNPVLDQQVPKLADLVAEHGADVVVKGILKQNG